MVLGSIDQQPRAIVSTRRGIAWGLNPRGEDSSVLVLTSPDRHYVDIRFSLDGEPTAGSFWAFAGNVTYTALPGVGEDSPVGIRGEWDHPIDSMGNTESVDKADLFTLENGDQIEIGLMENPDTGRDDRFMEYWTSPTSTRDSDHDMYVVAKLEEKGRTVGMVIRVGIYAQGIRQMTGSSTAVVVERWSRATGEWVRDARGNAEAGEIPMLWVLGATEAGQVGPGGAGWAIIEYRQ